MTSKCLQAFFMLLCLLYQNDSYADDLDEAEKAYKQGDFASASEKFLNAEIEEPDNLQHTYNRSVSQFQNKDYEGAASGFAKSAKSKDPNLARNSQFNLGNTLAAKGDLNGAKQAFSDLLKQSPDDLAAKENLAWVEKMIQEMEKQKQDQDQQNKDQDQDQDQQNKDQKDQDKDQGQQDQQDQDQQNKDQDQDQDQDQQNKDQKDQDKDQGQQDQQDQGQQDEKDQDQGQQDQQDRDRDRDQGQQDQSAQQNQQESQENLDKADAERLLRSLEDQERYYGKPPKMPPPDRRPIKDW